MAKKKADGKADAVKKSLGLEETQQNLYSGEHTYVAPLETPKGNKQTVIGIIEAEKLQKQGWRLISATHTSDDPFGDKEYKFERNK
jgi:hypothetical protein